MKTKMKTKMKTQTKTTKRLSTKLGVVILLMATTVFTGCSVLDNFSNLTNTQGTEISQNSEESSTVGNEALLSGTADLAGRKFIISEEAFSDLPEYAPCVPAYRTNSDFSNVENVDRVYLQDQMLQKLAQNNFVVVDTGYSEFFDLYEQNRYNQFPSFVTVDSMMHTYHLYFAMLQKNTEKEYLSDTVKAISSTMQNNSIAQYDLLKGSEWEEAAKINVAFFTVGALLMGEDVQIPDYVKDVADTEVNYISEAAGVEKSPLNGEMEDYSQYKPRGYYDGDDQLEKYFRTMMWYGRRNFVQKDETMDRCALLMTLALNNDAAKGWEEVYSITSFFAGASDDSGIYEYLPLILQAYGDKVTTKDLIGNAAAFDTYHQLTAELAPPKINSTVVADDGIEGNTVSDSKGFRFMGQRFTLDAEIFTRLCYDNVGANSAGDNRMLPDTLDIPAALGNDTALNMLKENGNYDYNGYQEEMEALRTEIASAPNTLWRGSLYGGWMNTIRPLLEPKGEGYPAFMQSEEWNKKSLESFLSSFTELKHDTVLYSKQFVAEMGGGDMEVLDDRGYVEPEPEVYARLAALSDCTAKGLDEFGIINENDKENLKLLSDIATRLKDISIKELTCENLTEDDYELIRSYGGNLEHFWREAIKDQSGEAYADSREFPAALVVDVATDPNGTVLEQAIGGVSTIYVVVPVEGKLRITSGCVFSYYQFEQPLSERLTDSEWRRMLGMELNENDEYENNENVRQPDWTQSYRSSWEYNN